MIKERLPVIISVPHAGQLIPESLKELSVLTESQIRIDGDEGADEIFSFEKEVSFFIKTPIARAFVDLNRQPDDIRLDGVVKTHTCQMDQIYRRPLNRLQVEELLNQHYHPWHKKLAEASSAPGVLFGIDCHTMAAAAPENADDTGAIRPLVCLSNAGATCPDSWLELMKDAFEVCFGNGNVSINTPFQGGYIIREHSRNTSWIQLELSREPFVTNNEKRSAVLSVIKQLADHVKQY